MLEELAADWYARLQAGDVSRRACDRWIAADPAHARAWNEIAATAVLVTRGVEGQRAGPDAATRPQRRRAVAGMAMAAGLGLAAVATAWTLGLWPAERIRTAAGETRRVQLADGSTVHLNGGTTLVLHFSEGERALELRQGQALFEVAKDPARPFRVRAGAAVVEAVGTAFDVDRHQGSVDVAVSEGVVALGEARLQPGQGVSVDATGALGPVHAVSLSQVAVWRRNMLFYQDVPFGTVVSTLQRHYAGSFRVGDAALAATRVSVSVNLQDRETTLRAIERLLSVRAVTENGNTVFLPATEKTRR